MEGLSRKNHFMMILKESDLLRKEIEEKFSAENAGDYNRISAIRNGAFIELLKANIPYAEKDNMLVITIDDDEFGMSKSYLKQFIGEKNYTALLSDKSVPATRDYTNRSFDEVSSDNYNLSDVELHREESVSEAIARLEMESSSEIDLSADNKTPTPQIDANEIKKMVEETVSGTVTAAVKDVVSNIVPQPTQQPDIQAEIRKAMDETKKHLEKAQKDAISDAINTIEMTKVPDIDYRKEIHNALLQTKEELKENQKEIKTSIPKEVVVEKQIIKEIQPEPINTVTTPENTSANVVEEPTIIPTEESHEDAVEKTPAITEPEDVLEKPTEPVPSKITPKESNPGLYGPDLRNIQIDSMYKNDFTFTYNQVIIKENDQEVAQAEIIVMPLNLSEKYPDILVWVGYNQSSFMFVSKGEKNTVRVDLGDYFVIVSGEMKGEKFMSTIFTTAGCRKKGITADVVNSRDFGNKGHIIQLDEKVEVHVLPVTFKNNENDNADFIYYVKMEDKEILGNTEKSDLAVFDYYGKKLEIVCKWNPDDDCLYSVVRPASA